LPDGKGIMKSRFRKAFRENKADIVMIVLGLVFLAASVPVFIFYHIFPAINSEIGPHQISSWISVTFSFIGFGFLILGMGRLNK
jgi:hypothetical protein